MDRHRPSYRTAESRSRRACFKDLRIFTLLLLTFLPCSANVGCTKKEISPPRVVVLGVDGLDLRLLDRLVKEQPAKLPSFARLYREGTVGPVSTKEAGLPPISPRIWTTVATGQLPRVHGLPGFVYTDASGTRRLYSSLQRKVPAAWEIATAVGKSVGVVNWWFTYPAEKVDGFVVSDRYLENWSRRSAKFYGGELDQANGALVYPPALIDKLRSVGSEPNMNAMNPDAAEAIDRMIFNLAFTAMDTYPTELLMIYTRALDELCHLRWSTHESLPGEEPPASDEIVEYMQRYDAMLAELLARIRPEDTLVVVSDHGFERNRTGKGPAGVHLSAESAAGTLILTGPQFRRGGRITGATILDILPTLLAVMQIPPAEDMPGHVLKQAMAPGADQPLTRVAAYTRTPRAEDDGPTQADPATIERLRALGYLK